MAIFLFAGRQFLSIFGWRTGNIDKILQLNFTTNSTSKIGLNPFLPTRHKKNGKTNEISLRHFPTRLPSLLIFSKPRSPLSCVQAHLLPKHLGQYHSCARCQTACQSNQNQERAHRGLDSEPSHGDFDTSDVGSTIPSDASHHIWPMLAVLWAFLTSSWRYLNMLQERKRFLKDVTRPQNSLTKVMLLLMKTPMWIHPIWMRWRRSNPSLVADQ